eukprot:TRINITY_DN2290_c0_g1_i1.p1 TRINITY_DN2290_c0_g1~~TRINITY_DN2290_c0_g1_i1.p1  ORF type:complete len:357 (-),score=62.23 TRINITY_DN2290_c0_g1_i1:1051-2121(-)
MAKAAPWAARLWLTMGNELSDSSTHSEPSNLSRSIAEIRKEIRLQIDPISRSFDGFVLRSDHTESVLPPESSLPASGGSDGEAAHPGVPVLQVTPLDPPAKEPDRGPPSFRQVHAIMTEWRSVERLIQPSPSGSSFTILSPPEDDAASDRGPQPGSSQPADHEPLAGDRSSGRRASVSVGVRELEEGDSGVGVPCEESESFEHFAVLEDDPPAVLCPPREIGAESESASAERGRHPADTAAPRGLALDRGAPGGRLGNSGDSVDSGAESDSWDDVGDASDAHDSADTSRLLEFVREVHDGAVPLGREIDAFLRPVGNRIEAALGEVALDIRAAFARLRDKEEAEAARRSMAVYEDL